MQLPPTILLCRRIDRNSLRYNDLRQHSQRFHYALYASYAYQGWASHESRPPNWQFMRAGEIIYASLVPNVQSITGFAYRILTDRELVGK
jgi:hypothetical protein